MSRTAMIRARTEPKLKREVDKIFKKLGLSSTEAINIFYKRVRMSRGIPFEVKIPNDETRETFEKTDKGQELIKTKNIKDFYKKLKI